MIHRKAGRWTDRWRNKDNPEHRFDTPEWYAFCARELLLLFPPKRARALELGCGRGDLYPFMRNSFSSYRGVDISPLMLEQFRSRWPEAHLVCANASRYTDGQQYDLIVSNQLVQYFDKQMLRSMLRNARQMLAPDGVCVLAGIPDAALRVHFYLGLLDPSRGARTRVEFLKDLLRLAKPYILRTGDGLGSWYSRRSVARLAQECGFHCRTFSSKAYEYRFDAVLTPVS